MITDGYPQWLQSEAQVKNFFRLLGFSVESVSINGRQIDVKATSTTFSQDRETWFVEITLERVGQDKGSSDYQKLDLARRDHPGAKVMLVGLNGFTDDQRTTLRKLDILPVTFTELEANVINLQQYAASSLTSLIADTKPDIGYDSSRYIEPELTFNSADGRTERIGARDWISAFLSNRDPIVYALLGNLGTGKTSFLKDLHQRCCRAYLDNPDYMPVSIFVPLGAFKQHSGDIQQMLLSIFRQHNVHNFPSAYIAHAIPERRIILLLDGLDEIHPIQNVDDILSTIVNLFDQLGQGCIAILSFRRELFLSTHEEMAYFGSYTGPRLADLQSRLAKKLSGQPNTKIIFLEPFDENRVKNYLLRRL